MVILLIAVPLLLSFAAQLMGKYGRFVPVAGTLFNLIVSATLIPVVMKEPFVVSIAGFPPPLGINLVASPLSIMFALLISLVGFIISIYATAYVEEKIEGKYHSLYLLLLTGALGVVLTGDIFNLFVFFEILCISSYALTAHNAHWHKHGTEGALKYLIQGSVGSAFILIGIGITYGLWGSLNMAEIARRSAGAESGAPLIAMIFFITGFGVEAALFPLNSWLPDAHSVAPAPASAAFSGLAVKMGIYAAARTAFTLFSISSVFGALTVMGLLSVVMGEMGAFRQLNLKRMSAFSTMGQAGLIVFALSMATHQGVEAGLFQIITHALSKSLLFLGIGCMVYTVRMRTYPDVYVSEINIRSVRGMSSVAPFASMAFLVGAFSLIGFPPFVGFCSKFLIVKAALAKGGIYPFLLVIILLATVIEGVYFLRVVQNIFFEDCKLDKNIKNAEERTRAHSPSVIIPMLLLMTIILLIGVFPFVLTGLLDSAADELLKKADYIRMVLG